MLVRHLNFEADTADRPPCANFIELLLNHVDVKFSPQTLVARDAELQLQFRTVAGIQHQSIEYCTIWVGDSKCVS